MVPTGSKQSIGILKSEYFQNMTWEMTWEFRILNYEAIFTKFLAQAFFDKAGWMVNFEIDQYTVCTYILNAHFSSNLCLQAPYETSWEANLVITMCWEQARFSCWWQHLPRLVATIKILCWLCGNHWLCRNCWFWLCRNLRVGAAGPPKYSTPWLLWTPINFLIYHRLNIWLFS